MQQPLKRTLDLALTIPALVFLVPVLLLIGITVRISAGRPVIFRHQRAGKDGVPFTMLKFRTMTDARDHDGDLLPDAERLTRVGCFLRAASMDELPQLWNVLRGEMSLVGPRPLPVLYLDRYTPEQSRRHELLPGITGLAQVNGRNGLNWQEKFRLDVEYVEHWSLWLDIKIMARTIRAVMRREGIACPGHVTAPEFSGEATAIEGSHG